MAMEDAKPDGEAEESLFCLCVAELLGVVLLGWYGVCGCHVCEIKAAKSIGHNIAGAFEPLDIGGIFFQIQTPSHDTITVKMFVGQVLVISIDSELLA